MASSSALPWTSDRILRLRLTMKLNRSAFGTLVGVTGRAVENWEQGLRHPSRSSRMLLSTLERTAKPDDTAQPLRAGRPRKA